jgi:hypothetical protein
MAEAETNQELGYGPLEIEIKGAMGAGKTHVARWIAARLQGQGMSVDIIDAGERPPVPVISGMLNRPKRITITTSINNDV